MSSVESYTSETNETALPIQTQLFEVLREHPEYVAAAARAFEEHASEARFTHGTTTFGVANTIDGISIYGQRPMAENPETLDTWRLDIGPIVALTHTLRQPTGPYVLPGSGAFLGNLPIPDNVDPLLTFFVGTGLRENPQTTYAGVGNDRRFSQPAVA